MGRFIVTLKDDVRVFAFNGGSLVCSLDDCFSSVGECVRAIGRKMNGRKYTEVEIVNETRGGCAFYTPAGKKIS